MSFSSVWSFSLILFSSIFISLFQRPRQRLLSFFYRHAILLTEHENSSAEHRSTGPLRTKATSKICGKRNSCRQIGIPRFLESRAYWDRTSDGEPSYSILRMSTAAYGDDPGQSQFCAYFMVQNLCRIFRNQGISARLSIYTSMESSRL